MHLISTAHGRLAQTATVCAVKSISVHIEDFMAYEMVSREQVLIQEALKRNKFVSAGSTVRQTTKLEL